MKNETKIKISEFFKKDSTVKNIESLKAVGYAFLIGLFLIIVTGQSSSIIDFFSGFWTENFSTNLKTSNTIALLSYLIPLSLALMVSFRMGLFNIGAAGQALGGGLTAYVIACNINMGQVGWLLPLLIGIGVGSLIALSIGWLKVKFNINEVISSIMINWMIFYLVKYAAFPDSLKLVEHSMNDLRMDWFNTIFGVKGTSSSMNIGLLIIIPLPFVFWFAYKKTKWGYKQDLIGNNPKVGDYLNIDSDKEILKTMALSGALAGLAGSIYYLGVDIYLPNDGIKDIPGWTFNGITIALLGFNSPIGIIISAFIFSLFNDSMDLIVGDFGIVSIMVAVMILFIARSSYRINYGKRGYLDVIKAKFNNYEFFNRKKEKDRVDKVENKINHDTIKKEGGDKNG